jgi:hypothetical protein
LVGHEKNRWFPVGEASKEPGLPDSAPADERQSVTSRAFPPLLEPRQVVGAVEELLYGLPVVGLHRIIHISISRFIVL